MMRVFKGILPIYMEGIPIEHKHNKSDLINFPKILNMLFVLIIQTIHLSEDEYESWRKKKKQQKTQTFFLISSNLKSDSFTRSLIICQTKLVVWLFMKFFSCNKRK